MDVPIWEKACMTIEEASKYSNIGINKLQELASDPNCCFVLYVGRKKLIKKQQFDKFIASSLEI